MSLICCLPLPFSYQWVWDGMGPYAWCISYCVTQRKCIQWRIDDFWMLWSCLVWCYSRTAWMSHHEVLDCSDQLEGFGAWCLWVFAQRSSDDFDAGRWSSWHPRWSLRIGSWPYHCPDLKHLCILEISHRHWKRPEESKHTMQLIAQHLLLD